MSGRILVLAGTAEAVALCAVLSKSQVPAIASLAGTTRTSGSLAVERRIGGFGGLAGLTDWLKAEKASALIDATHPFARQMPWAAARAAADLGIPRLRLLRDPFPAEAASDYVDSLAHAVQHVPAGARVFMATGRRETAEIAERTDCTFILRSIDPAERLPVHIRTLTARPSADVSAELALLRAHAITHVISRDSGGIGLAKLEAARLHGARTILIRRPLQPDGPRAATVDAAVAWLKHEVVFRPPPAIDVHSHDQSA